MTEAATAELVYVDSIEDLVEEERARSELEAPLPVADKRRKELLTPTEAYARRYRLPTDIEDPHLPAKDWLAGKRVLSISGCELTYFLEHLETYGVNVHHTFRAGTSMDPFAEVQDPGSALWSFQPDYLVLSQIQLLKPLFIKIEMNSAAYKRDKQIRDVEIILDGLRQAIDKIRASVQCPIWLMGYPLVYNPALGLHEYRSNPDAMSVYELHLFIKLKMYELAKEYPSIYILDTDLALERAGKASGGRFAVRPESWGGHLERLGSAYLVEHFYYQTCLINTKFKRVKCIIADLDNTLWKGVLREDQHTGVKLYKDRLATLAQLANRGIVLALVTKNDPTEEAVIKEVITMGGRNGRFVKLWNSFIIKKINWEPKSANIRAIVEELDIGMDSVAFFDDNAFERAEVEANCPGIQVYPETDICAALQWYHFHPAGELTAEASKRLDKYRHQQQRAEAQKTHSSGNYEEFLMSCELALELAVAKPADMPRVEELLQRTNQLNATLKRLDGGSLRQRAEQGDAYSIYTARLRDRFGDYGMIGVCVVAKQPKQVQIEELAFSCRAMGRSVEHALLSRILTDAQGAGAERVSIDVSATDRNAKMQEILKEVGFEAGAAQGDGTVPHVFRLAEAKIPAYAKWFTIV